MEKLFSTEQRIRILQEVIFKTEAISVNKIADQLNLSKGLVSKYFNILTDAGILKKEKGKLRIKDFSLVRGIKVLLNVKSIDVRLFKQFPFILSAGLYGSCARGENTETSDVDLWIKVSDISERDLASLTSRLNKQTGNIKPLFLTDERIKSIKKEDPLFYHSLVFGSIILYGEKDGIQL